MYIISLDKKLMRVQHRLTKQQVLEIQQMHKESAENVDKQIKREMYQKFMMAIAKNIPTVMQTDDEFLTYTVSGYVLNERDMLNTIKEVLEIDGEMKERMLKQINETLGIYA